MSPAVGIDDSRDYARDVEFWKPKADTIRRDPMSELGATTANKLGEIDLLLSISEF